MRIKTSWLIWSALSIGGGAWLAYMLTGTDSTLFLPGETSVGHHQIEASCRTCHTRPFEGASALQNACVECHREELSEANDSHPKRLFTDPRNAAQIAIVDATQCVTCHREHKPDITGVMGVTVARDFCFACHGNIARERPSHEGFSPTGCADAGCHNYHDNRALYEDFLVNHIDEPNTRSKAALPRRNWAKFARVHAQPPAIPLRAAQHNAPAQAAVTHTLIKQWEATGHAQAGVNCKDCHVPGAPGTNAAAWIDKPTHAGCNRCHQAEVAGFLHGKHGMRAAQNLSPMVAGAARLAMNTQAANTHQGCTACHAAHDFNTRRAAVDACLSCHNDTHSLAYRKSPHYALWQKESAGSTPGTGVSCATCHMPRTTKRERGADVVRVEHNQNANLRPNEKMLREVCMQCHGLSFALDALADPTLIQRNFAGRPAVHIESLDMARQRRGEKPPHKNRATQ